MIFACFVDRLQPNRLLETGYEIWTFWGLSKVTESEGHFGVPHHEISIIIRGTNIALSRVIPGLHMLAAASLEGIVC